MSDAHGHDDGPTDWDETPDGVADAKVEGDVTAPAGHGTTSGEDDYVAVNGGGISGERHVPTADEEVGRGSTSDPDAERYPEEERGD
ncbi:hypothetical protein [Frondihabitans australicus]|uniref:Uncharacterized protein n=1 Tax=Frondihabitans australicus TaxID=386892 RepID=A0A495IIX9_9MICO|nr:hypothetical protein [Frondihabitans australicus]RKR75660.1 hypothetical protein C8E83_2808 [Frondihabitans australicus]